MQLKFCSSVFQIVFRWTSEFCELKVSAAVIIIIIISLITLHYFAVMHSFI